MRFDGNTHEVRVEGNKLIIKNKNSFLGKLDSMHSNKVVEINLSDITSIDCKDASIFSNGFIKFYVNGKASMQTTVMFFPRRGIYQEALHFAREVEELKRQQKSYSSVADELLKFKKLLDMGIITPEEFERKKRELLG